jgi:hypothetical protein
MDFQEKLQQNGCSVIQIYDSTRDPLREAIALNLN